MSIKWSFKKRFLVYSKTNGYCAYCGVKLSEGWHMDHIKPKFRGGDNSVENLFPSCGSCNSSKRNRTIEEFRVVCYFKFLGLGGLGLTLLSDLNKYALIPEAKSILEPIKNLMREAENYKFYFEKNIKFKLD